MMIRFESKTGSTVTMFEKDAEAMLRMMDQSGVIPSAIRGEDIGSALANLQSHLGTESAAVTEDGSNGEEDDAVDLPTRAYPLIQLLESAAANNESVMWDYNHSPL